MSQRFRYITYLFALAALCLSLPAVGTSPNARAGDEELKAAQEAKPAQRKAAGEGAVARALNSKVDLVYQETALKDVVVDLQQKTGITIYLNVKKLEEAAVSPDVPITCDFHDLTLRTGLKLLMDELECVANDQGEYLMITTPEDAETRLIVRIYDCRELLALTLGKAKATATPHESRSAIVVPTQPLSPATAPSPSARIPGAIVPQIGGLQPQVCSPGPASSPERDAANELVGIITSTVAPQSWDEVGGPASINDFNGLFIVSQTDSIHAEVEHLLGMLQRAAGLGDSDVKVTR
jgi:general secretion pathway protein D